MNISGRSSAAVLLVVGALGFSTADLVRKLVLPSNGAASATGLLGLVQAHSGLWLLAGLAMLLGSMAMLPGVAALASLVAGRGSGLTRAGALLLGGGLVASVGHALAYYGMAGAGAASGMPVAAYQSFDDESNRYPLFLPVIVLFMLGVVVGTVLLAVGLRRARQVPIWVPVAAIVFALTGAVSGVASGAVGVVAALATFGPVAWVLIRSPRAATVGSTPDVVATAP